MIEGTAGMTNDECSRYAPRAVAESQNGRQIVRSMRFFVVVRLRHTECAYYNRRRAWNDCMTEADGDG
jgi:hypothetical protein